MKLILVRGAPGAGKSTHAEQLGDTRLDECDAILIVEADDYFIRPDDVYDFNPKLIPDAHKWCQEKVRRNLDFCKREELPATIIVANTFTRLWEMQPYLDMAEEFGAAVEVHRCSGEYQNIHGVPDDKVRQMRERMEPFDGEVWV